MLAAYGHPIKIDSKSYDSAANLFCVQFTNTNYL